MNVLDGMPKLHQSLQGLSGDQQIAVIVHLSEKPVALAQGIKELEGKKLSAKDAANVKAKVGVQQKFLKKQMGLKGISHKLGFTYDTVLNGFFCNSKSR